MRDRKLKRNRDREGSFRQGSERARERQGERGRERGRGKE